jgi:hypothetical protein
MTKPRSRNQHKSDLMFRCLKFSKKDIKSWKSVSSKWVVDCVFCGYSKEHGLTKCSNCGLIDYTLYGK